MNIVIHEDALNRLPGNFLVVLRRLLSRVLTQNSYLAWGTNLMITISLGVIVLPYFPYLLYYMGIHVSTIGAGRAVAPLLFDIIN